MMAGRLGLLIGVLTAVACGKGDPAGPTATSIRLNFETLTLAQLDSAQLVASFVDSRGTLIAGVATTFSSSEPTIVSVSSIGVVRSLGPAGTATITVSGAGLSKPVTITVQRVAARLVVTPGSRVFPQQGTLQLMAQVFDRGDVPIADASLSFESSDTLVATVSASGLVRSLNRAGSVTITVRSGALSTTVPLTITPVPGHLKVLPTPLRLGAGRTVRLITQVLDIASIPIVGPNLSFTSLDPSIVTVTVDGFVTSRGPLGTASIRVEVVGTSLVTVIPVVVSTFAGPRFTVDTLVEGAGYAVALIGSQHAFVVSPFERFAAYVNLATRSVQPLAASLGGYAVAVAKDQRRAFLATRNRVLREIDLVVGTAVDVNVGADVFSVALSPDDRFAYLGTAEEEFLIVDLVSRTVVSRIAVPTVGLHITIDPAGRRVYVSGGSELFEIDLTSRTLARTFDMSAAQSSAISADGRTLYVADEPGTLNIVDLISGNIAAYLTPSCMPWGLALTPDERFAYLACSRQDLIAVMDLAAKQIVHSFTGFSQPRRVTVSADGT
ncbi:MAG: YncE family protein, partial [Gemmatimonadaceae bacterium]